MALCRTGGFILKSIKPILTNPCFVVPSSVNLQVRHAARKGYREKARRAKGALASQPAVVTKEISRIKKKYKKIEKTENLKKPEPPPDDVIIRDHFNYKKYTVPEAVMLHREYHHPEIFNNPFAPVSLRIEINMVGKTQHQFIKPFHGIVSIPHPFVISHKKEVLVLCNPEDTEMALSSGASIAGGVELVQKIKEGIVQPNLYEYVITHTNFLPNLTPIRTMLKDQLPRARIGTLTNDLKSAIYRFLHGVEYSCVRFGTAQDFGIIDCCIGTIEMEPQHLEENFKAVVADVLKNKPPRDGDFISWVWCLSLPSPEEFSIDLSKYVTTEKKTGDEEEEEEEQFSERDQEKQAKLKLVQDLQEEELMSKKA